MLGKVGAKSLPIKCRSGTSSVSISWVPVRNTESKPHPGHLDQNLPFSKTPGDLCAHEGLRIIALKFVSTEKMEILIFFVCFFPDLLLCFFT